MSFREQQGLVYGMLQVQRTAWALGSAKSLPPTAGVQKPPSAVHHAGRGDFMKGSQLSQA